MARKKKKKGYRLLTPALVLTALSLASCEAASALIPMAKPAADRTIEVIQHPAVADANQDGKSSLWEKLSYILLGGGGIAAAYIKAHGAQKEVDQQWDAKLAEKTAQADAAAKKQA